MIEINLLPDSLRKRSTNKEKNKPLMGLSRTKFAPLAVGAAGLIIFFQVVLLLVIFANKSRISGYAAKEKALESNERIVEALKSEEKMLQSKARYIEEIGKKGILWSKKLNDLSACVTNGVWLGAISIEKETIQQAAPPTPAAKPKKYLVHSLTISGSAVSAEGDETALIGKFVKKLKENASFMHDFDEVTLLTSNRKKIKSVDVMEFVLTCPFKNKEETF